MPGLSDTSPDIERVRTECYRRMPTWRKLALLDDANRTLRALHAAGFRSRHPAAPPTAVWADWLNKSLGPALAAKVLEVVPMSHLPAEAVRVTAEVMSALKGLGVRCALGGSFASTVHGDPRSTQDADVMAEPFPGREESLASVLGPVYYLNTDTVREANRRRSGFNIIHTTTGFKVDVFIQKVRSFDASVLDRRSPHPFTPEPSDTLDVVSPEDSILLKLEWFRIGGEISDRQWGDIQGVMRTQADRLDLAYLHKWADEIGVGDLLAKALAEAGLMPF
ncbi:MAG: hypothetical protein U0871_17635 [Gemmataceae bacterium]